MAPAPDAFDLRQFAPPDGVTVTLSSGQSYLFPGDPYTDDVARMLRLEEAMADADGAELAGNLEESIELIKKLALQADPGQDVATMRIGSSELVIVFSLLLHGKSVAEAIARALVVADEADNPDEREKVAGPPGSENPLAESAELPASA